MTDKTVSISSKSPAKPNARRVIIATTVTAWVILGIGVLLCLLNLNDFNDRNVGLMIGIGFLIASVFIYVIGMAINLTDAHVQSLKKNDQDPPE